MPDMRIKVPPLDLDDRARVQAYRLKALSMSDMQQDFQVEVQL